LLTSIADRLPVGAQLLSLRTRADQIWGVQIVFAGNADEREQSVAPGIGQGRAHAMRPFSLRNRADWPVRGDPFSRRMRQYRCQIDDPRRLIDHRSLHGSDLMLA
jgi:hypothetical protein